jgi:glucose/arabinose dehydrogenase
MVAAAGPAAAEIRTRRVVHGLDDAVAFTFDARGRVWYVEKTRGQVRVAVPGERRTRLIWRIPHVDGSFAQGPLGIALHPRSPEVAAVYVYVTRGLRGGLFDQIVRLRLRHGKVAAHRVIFSSRARPGALHDGGRILFGPDGTLWVTVGDAGDERAAQELTSFRGKVLRLDTDGSPAGRSRIWARGFRNPWGSDVDPRTGRLWVTDNGPDCNDELNLVAHGGNYGWGPSWSCRGRAPRNTNRAGAHPVMPVRWYTPPIAPTGLAFCDDCGLGARSEGALFFGAYNTREIRRVFLDRSRRGVRHQQVVMRANGRVLSMEADPRGRLYFTSGKAIFRLVRR